MEHELFPQLMQIMLKLDENPPNDTHQSLIITALKAIIIIIHHEDVKNQLNELSKEVKDLKLNFKVLKDLMKEYNNDIEYMIKHLHKLENKD